MTTPGFVAGQTTPPFDALGRDYNNDGKGNGFTIPSVLGIDSCPALLPQRSVRDARLRAQQRQAPHLHAGRGPGSQPDALANAKDRARVVAFLRSLD